MSMWKCSKGHLFQVLEASDYVPTFCPTIHIPTQTECDGVVSKVVVEPKKKQTREEKQQKDVELVKKFREKRAAQRKKSGNKS